MKRVGVIHKTWVGVAPIHPIRNQTVGVQDLHAPSDSFLHAAVAPFDPPLRRWPGNYDFCKTRKSHLQQAVLTITKTRDPKQMNVELKSLQNMFLKKCGGKIYVC